MMKSIHCLTDFSDCSQHAERVATALAERTGAKLVFIHGVVVGVLEWDRLPEQTRRKYPEVHQRIGEAVRELTRRKDEAAAKGIAASFEIRYADGQRNMAPLLLRGDYDLTVLGAQGYGEHGPHGIGANAIKILRVSPKPVLIVKSAPAQPVPFERVVFATGMEPDTYPAFETLLNFSKQFGCKEMHLLAVTTPHNFRPTSHTLQAMRQFVERYAADHLHLHTYNHYSVEAGILEFADQIDAHLIGIANHGRTDLTGLFIESIPENLVRYGSRPVLSIRV